VHGNALEGEARTFSEEWAGALGAAPLEADAAPLPQTLPPAAASERPEASPRARRWLEGGAMRLRSVASNPGEKNSAIELHLHLGELELERRGGGAVEPVPSHSTLPSTGELEPREEARLRLLASVASKDAFHCLRTVRRRRAACSRARSAEVSRDRPR